MDAYERTLTDRLNFMTVDDRESSLEPICAALRGLELECRSFRDARAALEAMAIAPADVLVTHDCTPGMDGCRLIEMVRTRYPNTLIVAVSGTSDTGNVLDWGPRYDRTAPDCLLGQPVDPVALLATLALIVQYPVMAPDAHPTPNATPGALVRAATRTWPRCMGPARPHARRSGAKAQG